METKNLDSLYAGVPIAESIFEGFKHLVEFSLIMKVSFHYCTGVLTYVVILKHFILKLTLHKK